MADFAGVLVPVDPGLEGLPEAVERPAQDPGPPPVPELVPDDGGLIPSEATEAVVVFVD